MPAFPGIKMVECSPQILWKRIRDGEVYSHTRMGDGEWLGILGKASSQRRNCDGHRYFPAMNRGLRKILTEPPDEKFLLGMQHFGFRTMRMPILRWLKTQGLLDRLWYDADLLAMHRVSGHGRIRGYFEALATRPVVMVGHPRLKKLKQRGLVDFAAHIVTPVRDAFRALPDLKQKTLKAYSRLEPPVVISISCGLPAGILVQRLFREIGQEAFIFDAGSVYDVYCGEPTRGYMRKLRQSWARGKGNAPNSIRVSMEKRAAGGDSAVRESSVECQGDS